MSNNYSKINKTEEEITRGWKDDFENPLVSIVCTAYNHEKYISSALDGFLIQKTNFPFEVIVHDDASTDNTVNIIKDYVKDYPNIIKPIYEKENQYSKNKANISKIVNEKLKGKYYAICEGDDYWIDSHKLQKQVDYLEQHKDCSLVLTNCYEEDVYGNRTKSNPFERNGILSNEELIKENGKLPPTCSMIYSIDSLKKMPSFFNEAPVGDRPQRFYLITIGYVYYMDEIMCVHRKGTEGSFTQRTANNKEYAISVFNGMIDFYDKYDEYTNNKYHKEIELVKEREEYYLYVRTNNKKMYINCNYFKKNTKIMDKIKIYASFYCPKWIKNIIKKI